MRAQPQPGFNYGREWSVQGRCGSLGSMIGVADSVPTVREAGMGFVDAANSRVICVTVEILTPKAISTGLTIQN